MIVDYFNTSYYVNDYLANTIYLLNDDYGYVTKKTFTSPTYMVDINSSLYITGENNMWKTDKYLNVLITYNESGNYRGIHFNSTENLIYVASKAYYYIQVFNINLTLNDTLNINSYNPYSLSEYNNELYVGTTTGSILVVVNRAIIRSFTVCSSSRANSIVFDNFGLLAITCESNSIINFYYSNGTYTGNSLATTLYPMFVGFDSKRRFVYLSKSQIKIHY